MSNFVPLKIETIVPDMAIQFSLYILFKGQHLVYLAPGARIDSGKLEKLKHQQVARFLLKQEEMPLYKKYLAELIQRTNNDPKASVETKVAVVEAAATTAIEGMQTENPMPNKETYAITQSAANGLRQVIASNPTALKKFFGKTVDESEKVIKHCVNVSALCAKIGETVQLIPEELNDLCTAALLHDIGIVKLPKTDRSLFSKEKRKYTADDMRLYNFHVKNAEQILRDKDFVTKSVLDLVLSHEEVLSGAGPQKKKKLTLPEEVLSMCNCYDKRVMTQGVSPKEVLKSMLMEEMGNYDLKLLKHFKKILVQEGLADA